MDFFSSIVGRVAYFFGFNQEKEIDDHIQISTVLHGVVTEVGTFWGIIDDLYSFNTKYEDLKVGDQVAFLSDEKFSAYNIVKFVSSIERSVPTTEIEGEIEFKEGRKHIVHSDFHPSSIIFHLDYVEVEFIPHIGDCVVLTCTVDSAGVVNVLKVRPLKHRLELGYISQRDSEGGIINKNVNFSLDSCEPGYNPAIGDKVLCSVISNTYNGFNWRAFLVCQKKVNIFERGRLERSWLPMKSRNGIVIDSIDFALVQLGQSEIVTVYLVNVLRVPHEFKSLVIVPDDGEVALLEPMNCHFQIQSKETIEFKLRIEPRTIGWTSYKLKWSFDSFHVETTLEVSSVLTVHNYEQPQLNDYFMNGKKEKMSLVEISQTKKIIMPGERPIKPVNFIQVRMPEYPVPEDLLFNSKCSLEWAVKDQILQTQALRPQLAETLSPLNYNIKFHTLLYLEEIFSLMQIADLSLEGVTFSKKNDYSVLELPPNGKHESLLSTGDRVYAKPNFHGRWNEGQESQLIYEGFIFEAINLTLLIKFHKSFDRDSDHKILFDVSFGISRTIIRRQHHAIDLCTKQLGFDWLFPSKILTKAQQIIIQGESSGKDPIPCLKYEEPLVQSQKNGCSTNRNKSGKRNFFKKTNPLKKHVHWYSASINKEQKEAVKNILQGICRPMPYIIFGPPGTGKTVTLVETILQIASLVGSSRLLIAAPSNSAIDILALKLLESGIEENDIIRLASYKHLKEGHLPVVLEGITANPCFKHNPERGADFKTVNKDDIGKFKLVLGTLGILGILNNMGFPRGHFTHILIDEAGQTIEPESLIPLSLLDKSSGQVILAGDPVQLGPVVLSPIANRCGMNESLLQRLIMAFPYARDRNTYPNSNGYDPRFITKLIRNYRSLPLLVSFTSTTFYESELIAMVSDEESAERKLLLELNSVASVFEGTPSPIVYHDIKGNEQKTDNSTSYFNEHEAMQVAKYIMELYNTKITCGQIGVVTPYISQVKIISRILEKLKLEAPKIGSVELFQGEEKDIIILSLVRTNSKANLDFVFNPNRINVAISRAKSLLIVIGDQTVIKKSPKWKMYIEYCKHFNSFRTKRT